MSKKMADREGNTDTDAPLRYWEQAWCDEIISRTFARQALEGRLDRRWSQLRFTFDTAVEDDVRCEGGVILGTWKHPHTLFRRHPNGPTLIGDFSQLGHLGSSGGREVR